VPIPTCADKNIGNAKRKREKVIVKRIN